MSEPGEKAPHAIQARSRMTFSFCNVLSASLTFEFCLIPEGSDSLGPF